VRISLSFRVSYRRGLSFRYGSSCVTSRAAPLRVLDRREEMREGSWMREPRPRLIRIESCLRWERVEEESRWVREGENGRAHTMKSDSGRYCSRVDGDRMSI
jgi:hypothetical protein